MTFRPQDSTEQKTLPPRVLQGELLMNGGTLYMRTNDGARGLVSVQGVLRLYRDRPIVLIIFDPAYKGGFA